MSEITATTAKARYIDTAEVAKMMRPQLRRTFPGVKFSVRISRYSGGSSIDIRWTDGPTVKQVEAVTHAFQSARFDGMIDLQYSANSWYCATHGARVAETYGHGMGDDGPVESRCCAAAELVHFGSGYIHEVRELSDGFRSVLAVQVRHESGMDKDAPMDERLPEGSLYQLYPYDTVRDGVYRLSVKTEHLPYGSTKTTP
ncbi:MAG TPA: LPD29 domain-containing protein [Propionibacteriaceae bacterium]|jgi:hypothetical protein|nr:LPD29 domain-containing protein [Propionibacteriaceae bacterium]